MTYCRYEYYGPNGKQFTPWFLSAYTGTNCVINKLKVQYKTT